MRRTTVCLPEEVDRAPLRLARKKGRSKAALICSYAERGEEELRALLEERP